LQDKPQLSIITHATAGSHFIKEGIHLRWSFHHKLGFPAEGFRLYRRESDPANRICINFSEINHTEVLLPFKYATSNHRRKPKITLKSKANHFKVRERVVGKSTRIKYLDMTNSRKIEAGFSMRTPRIELEFLVSRDTNFHISSISGRRLISTQKVVSKNSDVRKITIESFIADKLILEGKGIRLAKICYWVCEDEGANPWEGPINGSCGFGLPIKQTDKISREKQYTERIRKACLKECDADWAIAACRLGRENICGFKGDNFNDLKDVMESMRGEGVTVPVGWNSLVYDSEPACLDDEDSPSLDVSPYELLLLQSENSEIAKMLGLYWIDSTAEDGKYYDYKVEASWPAKPRSLWKLDGVTTFEDLEAGQEMPNFFYKDRCIFAGLNPKILKYTSGFGRVEKGLGLSYPSTSPFVIFFSRMVKEVQVFISQEGPRASLTAFSSTGTVLDVSVLLAREGVLSVHAEDLRGVRLEGKGIVILRVHHDREYLEFGDRKAIICGVIKKPEQKLATPTGLKATCLLGSVTEIGDDCVEVQNRFRVGLRWNLVGDEEIGLNAGAPIGYLVERTDPRGDIVLITGDNPVHVVPVDKEVAEEIDGIAAEDGQPTKQKDCSGAVVEDRQYFKDSVDEKGDYFYRICSVDIFGRRSDFSAPEKVSLYPPLPAPPMDVMAKFIDINTYNAAENTFSDPNISAEDKEWLATRGTSALVVSWKWTKGLREQSPNARRFNIHFKEGWLNLIRGTATAVRTVRDNFEIETDITLDLALNSLTDEWLRQGSRYTYKIIANSAGTNTTITVRRPPEYLNLPPSDIPPKAGVEFTLPVTRLESDGGAAKEYTDPAEWGAPVTSEGVIDPFKEVYKKYFPFSSFESNASNKTRYGQVSVGTLTDEGAGSVSSPAAVMSVYRTPPAKEEFSDAGDLLATAADFYGKSSFAYRWPKPGPGLNIKYSVYRAMDETLIMTDRNLRSNPATGRDSAFYQAVLNDLGIALSNAEKDNFKAAEPDYGAFNNNMMKALASLPGNEAAFSKLNEAPLSPDDPAYADRRIPGEPPYTPDGTKLLYVDATLDGRSPNRYFYRLRAVDEIGNMSPFYDSTLPVSIPQTTPPVAPSIAKITGGDRSITLEWAQRPGAGIVGYLIYRAEDELKAGDCRKMRLMKHAPAFEHQYTDTPVVPGKKYFYRLVAIGVDGLKSRPSQKFDATAAELTPPDAPEWDNATYNSAAGKLSLSWYCNQTQECLIMKKNMAIGKERPLTGWLSGTYDQVSIRWYFSVELDLPPSDAAGTFYVIGRSPGGYKTMSGETQLP